MTLDLARPLTSPTYRGGQLDPDVGADLLTSEQLASLDPSGLWQRVAELPDQAAHAWRIGTAWDGPAPGAIERVVVVGMGGSAIGAQLAARILAQRSPVGVEVLRDSSLPMMDARTLLVFCSFSGETEEILTAFRASLAQPTMKIAITRGGTLAREAAAAGVAAIQYDYDGEPRSALGYGTMLLLGLLHRFGVFPATNEEIERTFAELRDCGDACRPDVALADNPARSLARQVADAVPVIVADISLAPAAVRWQNQCNENGKRWAFAGTLPEAMHNIVEGIQDRDATDLYGPRFHVIVLEDLSRPAAARRRLDAFQQHLCEAGIPWTRLPFSGASDLGILFQACVVGDWVSYYLAIDAGVDPSPVPIISRLKTNVALLGAAASR